MTLPWKKLDELLRNPRVEGKEFIEKEVFDRLVPSCPNCKKLLIYREPHRRFMEDDNYVECPNGHVFELVPPPPVEGLTAKEMIEQMADPRVVNPTQIKIARLFLEGKLYEGVDTKDDDGVVMKFIRIVDEKEHKHEDQAKLSDDEEPEDLGHYDCIICEEARQRELE